jgi:hypothetical protein
MRYSVVLKFAEHLSLNLKNLNPHLNQQEPYVLENA